MKVAAFHLKEQEVKLQEQGLEIRPLQYLLVAK